MVIAKLPPWSYTNLRDADTCLRLYHHKHILKDTPFEESEASRWGNRVHTAMENRLKSGKPLADGMQAYEQFVPEKSGHLRGLIEAKLGILADGTACDFFAADVWGRGKVDFALLNMEHHHAAIVDWKTGKMREDPDELEIFAVLLKAKYPALERITGWYVWLKECRLGKVHDLSDTNGKLANIKYRVQKLQEALKMDAWPARQNPLCPWCGVKSCEFHPQFNRLAQ